MRFGLPYWLFVATVIFLIVPGLVKSEDQFAPVYRPSLSIQRAAGEIKVDGWLNDPGWQSAATVDHFVESAPGDQTKPPVRTLAMLTYDNDYLYVGMIGFTDPTLVRASLCERDRTPGDDNLGIFIDTYGDAAWAYVFYANAYGVQYDAMWSNSFGTDTEYDLIWESAGQITDSGFQVELAIPFASLRFPNREKHEWRVEFHRYHEREVTYELTWCAYDRDESCWPCQWGTVTGIENVTPGKGIEIIPALVGYQSGQSTTIPRGDGMTDSLGWTNLDPDGELSLSTKYSIGSNATAELAFNPDFSQVEADADQIDVNSPTALSFPEKRPFFQEGRDLFQTLYDVVYTRSINDPAVAAKFTLRKGSTSIGYLGAYDEHSPVIIPFEDFSTSDLPGGKSASNILSARHNFSDNSQLGLLMTDRRFDGGGAGTALSLDGMLRLTKSLKWSWQAIATHTTEPNDTVFTAPGYLDRFDDDTATNLNDQLFDGQHTAGFNGESFWGHGLISILELETGNFYLSSRMSEVSPTFRLDNGFETRNNRRQASVVSYYVFRFDQGLLRSICPQVLPVRIWNTDGTVKEESIDLNLSIDLRKSQIRGCTDYTVGSELYRGIQFKRVWSFHQCMSMVPSKVLAFGGNINYGNQIAYSRQAMGRQTGLGLWCDLMPHERVQLENSYTHVRSKQTETGEELFNGFIARSRMSVQFSRELSVRFVVQYNEFSRAWDFDPLITYKLNPFTLFYIGTTYDYEKDYCLDPSGDFYAAAGEESCDMTRLKSRQFFIKLQYLFQL
jgi:hypothetical protein